MDEPKKFTFGFSKVVKKPALLTPKVVETVEYIKCVEDKAVKLVNEELAQPKPLPVIPMPKGSSVKDRILEAIQAREDAKSKNDSKVGTTEQNAVQVVATEAKLAQNGDSKPLSLDELAAKELIEGASSTGEKEKEDLVIPAADTAAANKALSTLDDYENMPISDFGQAMLRGMGWDPKKGIGLNEKVVVPTMPQVRPKGMGLGADKSMASQTAKSKNDEDAVLKKGSMVKVIGGPHNQLYGKVEAFEELPGRILVRLALGNEIVSMGEFMVQLVPLSEYTKNAKVMNLDKYSAALESSNNVKVEREIKSEQKFKPRDDGRSGRQIFAEPRSNRDVKSSYSREESSRRYNIKSRDSSHSSDDDYNVKKSRSRRDDSRDRSLKKEKFKKPDESDSDEKPKKSSSRHKSHKHKKKKKSRKRSSSESSSDDQKRREKRRDKKRDKDTYL